MNSPLQDIQISGTYFWRNPKYSGQKIMILKINGYIHYVPFVEDDDKYFLKSIIPSRKLNRKH